MRLPNGFGSVYKLSGKRRKPWVARKTTGYTFDEEAKTSYPIYTFIGYYATRQEALAALVDYNRDPYDLRTDTITFAEVYEKWSAAKFPEISPSNQKAYNAAYKVCAPLYDMKFATIKLDHLQKVVDESGKNAPTLKKVKTLFSQVFEYAVIHEIIPKDRDMTEYVNISRAGNPDAISRSPFTQKERSRLWDAAEKGSNVYFGVILILIYSGVRIGELLDLKKENVHLDERWFQIIASKTQSGIRQVPIAAKVLSFFDYWMKQPGEYLITTPDGKHMDYRNYYDSYWTPLLELLSMEHRPHDTRHTCISMLTSAGVPDKTVRKIVGHKGQSVTEAVYTHFEIQELIDAIDRI